MGKTKLVGILISAVLLGLVIWNPGGTRIDPGKLLTALRSANYLYVVPAACCTLTSYLLRTVRWRRILAPTRPIPVRRLFPVLVIGFMANNVLPARLGEVVRAYALGRKENVSRTLAFGTVMLERLLDGLTLVVFLALLSLGIRLPDQEVKIAYVASAVFFGAGLLVLILLLREDLARRAIALVLRPLPRDLAARLTIRADSFLLGLHSLRSKRSVLVLVGLSTAVWLVEALSYFFVLRAFGVALGPSETALVAPLMLVVVNLGIMVPSGPGYVGTFQFFAVQALGVFGVRGELALSIAIVVHAVQYVLVTGLGLIFVGRENISFRRIEGSGEAGVAAETARLVE